MAALFWNQARVTDKILQTINSSSCYNKCLIFTFQALVILMEISSDFPIFSSPVPFSSHLRGSSQFSHHCFYCWNCWVKEDVREKWNVSVIFSLHFDPSFPCTELPSGSRLLIWVCSEHFEKYRVSVTTISCCDRLTEWVISLRTLIQQRVVLSGGNLPQAGRQQGTF